MCLVVGVINTDFELPEEVLDRLISMKSQIIAQQRSERGEVQAAERQTNGVNPLKALSHEEII